MSYEICSCYHPIEHPGSYWNTPGCCWGTKEKEGCYCEGNPLKCDFYPEKRIPKAENKENVERFCPFRTKTVQLAGRPTGNGYPDIWTTQTNFLPCIEEKCVAFTHRQNRKGCALVKIEFD